MESDPILQSLGDSIYPNYHLQKMALIERNKMLQYPSFFTKQQITAFTLAMKSIYLLYNQKIQEASAVAMNALDYDISSIDAYQTLIQASSLFVDVDTQICLYRQLISLYKSQVLPKVFSIAQPKPMPLKLHKRKSSKINQDPTNNDENIDSNINPSLMSNSENKFKIGFLDEKLTDEQVLQQLMLQPYLRLLFSLGEISFINDNAVLAMECYEEALRFDCDNDFAAEHLAISYIKVIGMKRNGIHPLPNRDIHHLMALLDRYDEVLNDEVKYCAKLVISYFDRNSQIKNWTDIFLEFNQKFPTSIAFIFEEENGKSQYPLIIAFSEWIDLVVDMHQLLYGNSEQFYKKILEKNRAQETYRNRQGRQVAAKVASTYLEKARDCLHNQNYLDVVNNCSLSKRMFHDANYPSERWYLNSPFAVISNRSISAMHMNLWLVACHDLRFTLAMNPKHAKSLILMRNVALNFGLDSLAQKMNEISEKVSQFLSNSDSENGRITDSEWLEMSKKAIAYLSLEAFVLEKQGKLDDEKLSHLMKVGIENFYCDIPCSTNLLDSLPWLNDQD